MPRKVVAPGANAKAKPANAPVSQKIQGGEKARVSSGEKKRVSSGEKKRVSSGEKARAAPREVAVNGASAAGPVATDDSPGGASSPTSPPPGDSTSPAQTLTRTQKRMQKEKLRKEERKRLAAEAGVDLLPRDPMAAERSKILSSLQQRLSQLPKLGSMTSSEALAAFQVQKKALEALEDDVQKAINDQTHKVKRPEGRTVVQAAHIAQKITDLIKMGRTEDEADRQHLNSLSSKLAATVCWENHRKFQTSLQAMLPEIDERKKENARAAEQARAMEKKFRVEDRIRVLKQMKSTDVDIAGDDDLKIVSQQVELSTEAVPIVFIPKMLRKIEKMFEVVLEQPQTQQGGGAGGPRMRSRAALLWGETEKVTACAEFLQTANFSGRTKTQLSRAAVMSLIGRGGVAIRKVEEEHKCLIDVDNNNEAVVYGMKDDIQKVLQVIQGIREEAEQQPQVYSITGLATHITRAMQALMQADLRTIEAETTVSIRVVGGGAPGGGGGQPSEGQIAIRGKPEVLEAAKQKVQEVIARLKVEELEADQGILSKLFGGGGGERTADGNHLAAQFALIREGSRVVITRDKKEGRLMIVGEGIDISEAKARLQELLIRAAYTPLRMTIQREQLKVITAEVRRNVEVETGAQVSLGRTPPTSRTVTLDIVGDDKEKEAAQDSIQMIVDTQAHIEELTYEMEQTRLDLLRDRGQRLREIESTHGLSISLQRDAQTMKIVGPVDKVMLCKNEIHDIDARNKQLEEGLETKAIPIENSKAALIIGKKGSTINNIISNSKINKIDVQDSQVMLKGTSTAIAIAESMINEALQSEGTTTTGAASASPRGHAAADGGSKDDEATGGGGAGGGRRLGGRGGGRGGHKGGPAKVAAAGPAAPAPDRESQLHFPTLGAAVLVESSKRRSRRRGGKSPTSGETPVSTGSPAAELADTPTTPTEAEPAALPDDPVVAVESTTPTSDTPAKTADMPITTETADKPITPEKADDPVTPEKADEAITPEKADELFTTETAEKPITSEASANAVTTGDAADENDKASLPVVTLEEDA